MNIFFTAMLKSKDEFFSRYDKKYLNEMYDGLSLIQYAVGNVDAESRYAITNFLLDEGADATVIDKRRLTMLHRLCSHIDHDIQQTTDLCQRLINLGVDINQLDDKNRLAIQYIINFSKFSDKELAPLYDVWFAQGKVDVTTKNDWGVSPLELAKKMPFRKELVKRMVNSLNQLNQNE